MAVPDYQSFMRPLLAYGADGSEKNMPAAIAALADHFNLSEDDRNQLVPSGKQTTLSNRVHWARTYLDKAGALERTRRSHFRVTDRGKKLLEQYPKKIGTAQLEKFPEFQAFRAPKNDTIVQADAEQPHPTQEPSVATPEERIAQAEAEIERALRDELLRRIGEMSPAFFENLVVNLIAAMGYGGGKEGVAKRLGKSGDEGIDGVVNEDALALDIVYIQAKRNAKGNTIQRPVLQQFAGALVGQSASKGVFVTTSSFSKGASDYAEKVPQRIVLIDGNELARLLIQYSVGVRVERTVAIKRLDIDYFEEPE
jgi:restriction system protein